MNGLEQDQLVPVDIAAEMLGLRPRETRAYRASLLSAGKLHLATNSVRVSSVIEAIRSNAIASVDEHLYESASSDTDAPLQVLSFFSGAMGLDQGLERAGLKTVLACETDQASRSTIRMNRPDIPLLGNMSLFDAKTVLAISGLGEGRAPDVIAGGPPCQAFSTAGKRLGLSDARGNVFMHFLDLIIDLKPRYAVIENVRGLLSMPVVPGTVSSEVLRKFPEKQEFFEKNGVIKLVTRSLERAGYAVSFNLYNAANFGSAQSRERVVIIAALGDEKVHHLRPTHSQNDSFGLPAWRTFRDIVAGLDGPHTSASFPEKRLQYFRLLNEGQNWRNLPLEIQEKAMGASFHLGGGKTGFYRRLAWDKPSPTLVTHPAMPATDLCHPAEDRPLSVEEYRRLQDFPDSWELAGTMVEKYKQLGNAVPVRLGEAIGKAIVAHAAGEGVEPIPGFEYSRYKGTDNEAIMTEVAQSTLF